MERSLAVSRPAGWDWLDEVPDDWVPPEDLSGPTGSVDTDLAIRLLSCEILGPEVRAAVGRFVTEQAQYLLWFLTEGRAAGIRALDAPDEVLRQRRVDASAALEITLDKAVDALKSRRTN